VVSALGADGAALSAALRRGDSGIQRDERFAGEPYTSASAGVAPLAANDEPRDLQLARHAARQCVAEAGVSDDVLRQGAVVLNINTGAGGEPLEIREPTIGARLLRERPARDTDIVAGELGSEGPRLSLMTACSSSATALGVALDLLRAGRARWALAGGAEPLSRLTYAGFSALRALDARPCRPFDRERAGLNLGEAAAMLLLEAVDDARVGDGELELAGYGVSADAHHMTAPHPEGRGAAAAMRAALADADIARADICYGNAHGTATARGDAAEAQALRAVLGEQRAAVSSTKGATGHTLGAAGALECTICALALREGFIPPTVGLQTPDDCCEGLDLVGEPRQGAPRVALSNSFAFGGTNTSVVLKMTGA